MARTVKSQEGKKARRRLKRARKAVRAMVADDRDHSVIKSAEAALFRAKRALYGLEA